MVQVSWEAIKDYADRKSLAVDWLEEPGRYIVFIAEHFYCTIRKYDPRSEEQIDFEDTYKAP